MEGCVWITTSSFVRFLFRWALPVLFLAYAFGSKTSHRVNEKFRFIVMTTVIHDLGLQQREIGAAKPDITVVYHFFCCNFLLFLPVFPRNGKKITLSGTRRCTYKLAKMIHDSLHVSFLTIKQIKLIHKYIEYDRHPSINIYVE